jgi:hypothetical protein
LEGIALLGLHRMDDAVQAFRDSLAAADELLALADTNVAALQVRALALTGLVAATADPPMAAALEAFTRARGVTTASGVIADTRRLFAQITRHSAINAFADILAAQDIP